MSQILSQPSQNQTCYFCPRNCAKTVYVRQYGQNKIIYLCEKHDLIPNNYGETQCILCGTDVHNPKNCSINPEDQTIHFICCSYICRKIKETIYREREVQKGLIC